MSDPNRPRDADLSIATERLPVDIGSRDENAVIDALFAADANYGDDLDYDTFPALNRNSSSFIADDGYNSNSYTSGLLGSVGLSAPQPKATVPGYDKPVRAKNFTAKSKQPASVVDRKIQAYKARAKQGPVKKK